MEHKLYKFLFGLFLLVAFASCCTQPKQPEKTEYTLEKRKAYFEDENSKYILVASHRGDWRNAPENSLQAIQNCINMGVDIVEIDVQESKDGVLVLMHDKSVNRTTKAKGLVKDFTLDSLQTMILTNGIGGKTSQTIPTLRDALLLCQGKILVNIDKGYAHADKCIALAKETGTLGQIIIKGLKTCSEAEQDLAAHLPECYFMPMVNLSRAGAQDSIDSYLAHRAPVAFEINLPADTFEIKNRFQQIKEKGSSVWMNSLWATLNGGYHDEQAYLDNTVYDWYIENGVRIIQTDRPQVLLDYLRKKGLHE